MLLAVWMAGCAALNDTNESIIRVESSQDTGKASRLTLLGVKAMEAGDRQRAAEMFRSAVKADEFYGPAHNNLGLLHYEQGNFYQAVLAFERAMELMPHDPAVYYNLGLALQSSGRVHEALDLYWQAVEMDPTNPNFLGNLVRLRVRLGEQGPQLTTQLHDLTLIETRPEWRRWADRQLALRFNESLDRGPETPDYLSDRGDEGDSEREPVDNVIDLTPTSEPSGDSSSNQRGDHQLDESARTLFSGPELRVSREFNAPQAKSRPMDPELLRAGP